MQKNREFVFAVQRLALSCDSEAWIVPEYNQKLRVGFDTEKVALEIMEFRAEIPISVFEKKLSVEASV